MKGKVYNCGDSRANMTKRQLAERIAEKIPCSIFSGKDSYDPDKRDYIVSNARLEATGWRPRYTLDDGIDELAKFYRMAGAQRFGNV